MGTVADMGRAEAVGQATRGEIFSQMLQHPRYLFRPWIPFVKAIEGEPFARQRLAALVLDLACADGIFAWATYPGPLDVGMDLDLPALAEARRLGAYRHLAAADARALPFRSESFPTITSVCAVEHMDGLPIVLGELSRVLAPAGRLFLTVPSEQFGALLLGSRIWRALGCPGRAAAYGARKNSRSHHVNILGEEGWGQALKAASLTVAMDFHREGGSEGRTGQLVDALLMAGHDVHLVGARIRGDWNPRVTRQVVPIVRHPKWLETLTFIRGAKRLVATERFDVVHNQIRPYLPGVVTVGGGCHRFYLEEVLPRERGALPAWARRISPLHRILLGLERRRYRAEGNTWVIANSRLNRDGILAHYPLPADRIRVVYNGVDPERFTPQNTARFRADTRRILALQDQDVALLFVGGNFSRKGLWLILEAVAQAGPVGTRLSVVVVGGGGAPAGTARSTRWGSTPG